MSRRFAGFDEFYPYYLSEHSRPACRRLHCIGTLAGLVLVIAAVVSARCWWIPAGPVFTYGCAWIGHFVFERNKPATFRWPLYSIRGDVRMTWEMVTGKVPF